MDSRPAPAEDDKVVLELRCCCCGVVLDTLVTPWLAKRVAVTSIWTTEPCWPCQHTLAN